jgi:hypothetical protein
MDLFDRLNGGEIIAVVAISGGILLALVLGLAGIIFTNWRLWHQFQSEAALKQEMIRKEMHVEDIERVIRATHPGMVEVRPAALAADKPLEQLSPRQLDARVATQLAGGKLDAEKLEQALAAVIASDAETKRAVVEAVGKMIDDGVEGEEILPCVLALCKAPRSAITVL